MSTPSLDQFENVDLQPAAFDHEAHVYVAWRYLQHHDVLEAIRRYRAGLRNIVKAFGAESKYHETITWFYMISIAERMEGKAGSDWDTFREQHGELFARQPSWLSRYYSPALLATPQARRQFVLPDVSGR